MNNCSIPGNCSISNSVNIRKDIYYQYICLGCATINFNILILLVLLTNMNVLKRSAFLFGLAIGDCLDGLSLTLSGILRLIRLNDNTIYKRIHPSTCMMGFTPFYLLGVHIPGTLLFFMGIERFVAFQFFAWYHKNWSEKFA